MGNKKNKTSSKNKPPQVKASASRKRKKKNPGESHSKEHKVGKKMGRDGVEGSVDSREKNTTTSPGKEQQPKPGPGSGKRKGKASSSEPVADPASTRPAPEPSPSPKKSSHCLVVGIGASAGGLDSFRRFLEAMPHDSGMAFVLIQHLAPHHESMMADLLSRYSRMPVVEAHDAMPIEPNHVYMIPPNKFIKIADGGLFLDKPLQPRGMRMPIDYFFRSLAEARRQRAVAIVLSGTGSDGAQGVKEVKAAGGMTIAQAPDTAEYDGMPQAAIATGMVDFVLPIIDMPQIVANYAQHPYIHSDDESQPLSETAPDHFKAIISLLRVHTNYDFRFYKKGTLNRRIQRRMGLRHIRNLAAYLQLLHGDSQEVRELFKDLLIGVTNFFRDKEAWTILANDVIKKIVEEKPNNEPIRVWVPGCATGEEAYSLAILLYEEFERQKKNHEVQIFSTDLDPEAIEVARAGLYPGSIQGDVSPERLRRFFQEVDDHYTVNKRLRASVVFATQNLIGDPPFSNLDLISCRNLLIYLEGDVQQKLLDMFHFALRRGGFLFLGNSESIGKRVKMFEVISKPWRIYRATGEKSRLPAGQFSKRLHQDESLKEEEGTIRQGGYPELNEIELARRILLNEFAPASVVVNYRMETQYFQGPVKKYLDFPSGEATNDLMALAIQVLRPKLRQAIQTAISDKTKTTVVVPRVPRDGDRVAVRIAVSPVPVPKGRESVLLVTFEEETGLSQPLLSSESAKAKKKSRKDKENTTRSESLLQIEQLEYELQATREDLQSTIEELETSNEELKASNEEVMSMNEELQSTNEELETSREELQSLNEELNTVNTQLEEKVNELENINNDLNNLLTSTDVATIFLDTEFSIRRFTNAAGEVLRIRQRDIGRPIQDLNLRVEDPHLLEDINLVMEKLQPIEKEVFDGDHRWFIRRILPYRTHENKIEGVVITFTEIGSLKETTKQLEQRESQQAAVARLGLMALGSTELRPLFEKVVREMSRTLDVQLVAILQKLEIETGLVLTAGTGWKQGVVGKTINGAAHDSQAGYTLTSGGPVIVEDLSNDRRFGGSKILEAHKAVSGISVLIGPTQAPWGVLSAHTTQFRHFTVDAVNFIQAIANLLYGTISSLRIRDQLSREANRAALIREAAVLAAEVGSLEEALKGCVDIMCRLGGWCLGHTFLIAEDHHRLTPTSYWQLPADGSLNKLRDVTNQMTFTVGDASLPGRAAGTGQVCWITDIMQDTSFSRSQQFIDLGIKGAFAFPIQVEGKPTAIAEFFNTDRIEPTEEFLETIEVLKEQFNRIFERHMAALTREKTQERLESIVHAAEVGTWEWDLLTDKGQWNQQLYELLGMDPSTEPSGDVFYQCVHPEDREKLRQVLQEVIKRGTNFYHEFRIIQPTGRELWLTARGEVSRDSQGKAVLMRGIYLDITDNKVAQEILHQHKENLEHQVNERTAEAEQRAQQLSDLAFQVVEVEEDVRQRIAQVMHDDLQQLLIAMRIRLHGKSESQGKWKEDIDQLIEQGLSSCRALVTDLSPPVLREWGTISGLRWLVRRAQEQHNLKVHLEHPKQDVEPGTHLKGMLFRSVQELLFNVVKHSQVKQAKLVMALANHAVTIMVEDKGKGFSAENVQKKSQQGFGLFSIKERMAAMGGKLHITSRPGEGTKVLLTLPLTEEAFRKKSPKKTDGEPKSRSTKDQGLTSVMDTLRVVVADDHAIVRDGIISLLNEEPTIQVVGEAGNGLELVQQAQVQKPDIVVADINMPEMDGIEATRQIKGEMPEIIVIALTMHDSPEMERAIREAGASEFIHKGRSLQKLVETIQRVKLGKKS